MFVGRRKGEVGAEALGRRVSATARREFVVPAFRRRGGRKSRHGRFGDHGRSDAALRRATAERGVGGRAA